ncbi:MAG: WecB/TagA/CpsF family glycosyltransferase [Bacteroidia bacterium]|nr:WecB/TagA/CpsF family glycosyltransferase [Bacteroidia bacterium]
MPPVVPLLNIEVHSLSFGEALDCIRSGTVYTPNVDHLRLLQRSRPFYEAYREAGWRLCDSRILLWASRMLGTPLQDQIAGSDFLPAYVRRHPDRRYALLGGTTPEAAAQARAALNRLAGREAVVAAWSPPFGFEQDAEQLARCIGWLRAQHADVVAVGLGAPKQELLIARIRQALPEVQLWIAAGAAIDFQGGYQRRAPAWMTRAGLEWAYRLAHDPLRLARRYLWHDLPVLGLLALQRMGRYRNPWPEAPKP